VLRTAIYYENRLGRNDGNPLYCHAALKRMQEKGLLEHDHLIPTGETKVFGQYDLNFWVDWGEDGLTGLLPYEPEWPKNGAPILYWASDTHLGYDYRLMRAKMSDLVFVAQKDAVDRMKADGVTAPVIWLPHAVEPRAYCDIDSEDGSKPYNFLTKKYDLCFVGHVSSQNRVDALDHMFREFPNFYYGQKLFNDAALKYAESKIVFNISMKDDLNMRCFEVMGSKSFLLTDHQSHIEDLFIPGKHLETYRSLDEAVDKARWYLKNDEARERIAKSGYEEVMKNHTIDKRLEVMLTEAKKLIGEK